MKELLDLLLKALAHYVDPPAMPALALLLSTLTFFLSVLLAVGSVWLAVAQRRLAQAQRRHIVVDQARYVQDLWHKANDTILKDPEHIKIMSKLWFGSDEEAKKSYLIFNHFNPIYTAYVSALYGSMPKHYRFELDTILKNFRENPLTLITFLEQRGYSPKFTKECKRRLIAFNRRAYIRRLLGFGTRRFRSGSACAERSSVSKEVSESGKST